MHPILGILIVNFVLCLICFIAYSSQIFIIWPWYGREVSVELLVLLVPFNFFVGTLLWNYYLCVNTDPGTVPDSWKPDSHSDGYEVKKLTGAPRYCRMCKLYKPPRTHHCRQCNRCVLRMDHHCPWINNCVGHFNYGHFIRFLFYVDVACSYHIAMVTGRIWGMSMSYWDALSGTELVFIILNYVACIPVLLAVGAFSLYHFHGLMGNTTTIEGWEKDKAATMVRRGKIREIRYPYNLGRRKNIESVLGKNRLLWCCPTIPPGNGLKYELAEGEDFSDEAWPPKDPARSQYEDPKKGFTLPHSPWTYENGTFNPDLAPSNSQLRQESQTRRRNRPVTGASEYPPYHPDYEPGATLDRTYDTSSDEDEVTNNPRVRRGSEGYEIRPVGREDMLHRYLEQLGETPGRYHRYIPMPDENSASETDDPVTNGTSGQ
ncbi:palmitoyltransferase pfa4 [Moniliophthora roreri MCA 2997]|uniref:Palmitoyltransferase PFA4 n=2 Tax=Moniliophthora roreri TaxID=221103 RepID=V2YGW1_MONRO|nr:palmitoyltransferase pfa4 [Moniliophthora roreri MCA 2997]